MTHSLTKIFLETLQKLLVVLIISSNLVFAEEISPETENLEEISKSNINGLLDTVFKNDYITPRGLLVTNTGLTIQVLGVLNLDVYKNAERGIENISVNFGIWNDLWTDQHDPKVGPWNELDWFIGFTVATKNNWIFQAQFLEFLSPPGNFKPENNAEFTLIYKDSGWKHPITFNPYVKLFWAISGDSTVVVGRPGGTYYFELGMLPTIKCPFPLTITFPTYLSMGPANFWNGGKLALKHNKSNFGVFSTGVNGKMPLRYISKNFGRLFMYLGVQYYYLINDNLLQAQLFTIKVPSIKSSHRNVGVGFIGLLFEY